MANDIEIIKQIEKQIGVILREVPLKDIMSYSNNGYALDNVGQVTALNLDYLKITDISLLKGLSGLTHLSLRANQITDLTPLRVLTKLETLWLHSNQITDLAPLAALTNLKNFGLENNQITDIKLLRTLTKLKDLYLWNNQITEFTPLSTLTNLTTLGLGKNLTTNLTPLSTLTNLEVLYSVENHITDLTPLTALTNLTGIDLRSNQITNLTPLSALTNLTKLNLRNNQITDLTPLAALTNLTELNVNKNQITALTPLRELKHLKTLDMRFNRIERLPSEIIAWWPEIDIRWQNGFRLAFNFYGNPLKYPPIEIVKQGKAAIKNYFDEIERASVLFLESKLLLVGSGDVGKTTLMKKLKDNTFQVVPGKEDTTRGIDIQDWTLDCPFPDCQTREVTIHFWDFGGQDILHATHQFFLTKRSLYLFVWDPRKEEETQSFDYWFNAVKLFGAGSPLIMVMNKADMRIKHIDEASFKDKFPNIARFHQVSCLTSLHIPELTATIRSSLSQMPHLLDRLPKRWLEIRDALNAMDLNYIDLYRYYSVCITHGMDKDKALFLSDYLHDLGIILHFRQDPVLEDTVILKPEWATGAVYALIDSLEIQQHKGRFARANLERYWDAEIFPAEKHSQLLRLMEKFELCFNIVGTDDYIIPELLPTQRPTAVDMEAYRSAGHLHLYYSYDFMPAGILTRFICRTHYLIRDNYYWKNGVELEFSGSYALVESDVARKRIRVSVSGTGKAQLMGVIRSHFDHIHETLNMKKDEHVFEEVPCICSKCLSPGEPHLFKYHVLQKLLTLDRDILCEKSYTDVSVQRLLNGLLPQHETGNLFDTLITTLSQLQGIKKTLQTDENSRNTVVALLLGTQGFRVKDQTRYGVSESGTGIGIPDIKIEDETGRAVSIIEALNLESLKTATINRHVKKLLANYDCSGLKENYIVVYASAKDFDELCRLYRAHLTRINYESYPLKGKIEKPETRFNRITAYRARHRCNVGETVLYHLLVEM